MRRECCARAYARVRPSAGAGANRRAVESRRTLAPPSCRRCQTRSISQPFAPNTSAPSLDERDVARRSARAVRSLVRRRRVAAQVPEPNAMTLATVDARRPAVRAHRAAEGRRRARLRVLHQLRQPQGPRARARARGGAPLLLAGARAAGAHRGRRRGRRCEPTADAYFAHPAAAVAPRRMGVAAERGAARPRCARAAIRGRASAALSRRRRPAPAALGRLSRRPRSRSNSGRAARRGCTIASRIARRRLAGASSGSRRDAPARRNPTLTALIALGIANHIVLAGQPRHRVARGAAPRRVHRGGRHAAGALRVAADVLRGGGRPPVRPRRRAPADARAARSRSRSAPSLPPLFAGLARALRQRHA